MLGATSLPDHSHEESIPRSLDNKADAPSCNICQQPYNSPDEQRECPVKLSCGHEFGLLCINKWLDVPGRRNGCPLCRATMFESARNDDEEENLEEGEIREYADDLVVVEDSFGELSRRYAEFRRNIEDRRAAGRVANENSTSIQTDATGARRTAFVVRDEEGWNEVTMDDEDDMSDEDSIEEENDPMYEPEVPHDYTRPSQYETIRIRERLIVGSMMEREWRHIDDQESAQGNYLRYSQLINKANERLEVIFTNALEVGMGSGDVERLQIRLEVLREIRLKDAKFHREAIQRQLEDAIKAAVIQTPKLDISFNIRLHNAQWITREITAAWVRGGVDNQISLCARALPGLWGALCACWDNKNLTPLQMMADVDVEALFQSDLELSSLNPGEARGQAYEVRVEEIQAEQTQAFDRLASIPEASQEHANALSEAIQSFERLRGLMAAQNLISS